jgi:glycosyltransferase involved in cell wall biosynthesis
MGATSQGPLRIAVVTETYPPEVNGVARTIGMMVDRLRTRGHSVQLVRPRQGEADAAGGEAGLETILRPGVRLPRYQELRMGLPAKRALRRAWRARPPDIVQVVTEGPLGGSAIAAARALRIPVVTEFHTNFHDYTRHYGFGLLTKVVAGYLRRLHNRADRTLVPTLQLQTLLAAAGYHRLAVVGRGIDPELFGPERRSRELRRSWSAGDRDLVVAYVGRLAPEKNLPLFVESCRAMQAVDSRLRVVLVGDGPEGAAMRAVHRDFVFAGMRSGIALAEHYASADILLFPSLTETFGNVTTEAMASRLAVVAFDYAAAREHIRHRVNGVLAPYAQSAPFVAAAQELAADAGLRARLRTQAAETARSLTWDRVVDDLEAIFRALVDQARASRATEGGTRASGPVVKPEVDHAPL